MTYLSVDNISFRYPSGHKAIENISMDFQKGEAVAIVGQNGAGKTTVAKLLNGLLKPTEGNVIIGERNSKDYTTAQISREVGYVFQNPDDQIFHNNVYSEIKYGPKKMNFTEEKIKENITKYAKLTGIEMYLDENPSELPDSIKKFVTITSVLVMNSNVIILDEPTAGQDLHSLKKLGKIIDFLVKEGKTIITITHDMEFVVDNFERVIVMANKQKIADAGTNNVFWDHEVLNKSDLKQTHISSVSHELKLNKEIMDVNQMIEYLSQFKNNKIKTL